MATRSGSRRGNGSTATKNQPGNQTPNTPDINESQIAALKVDQLRDRLRRRGITGTGDMRKDDLVKTLIKAMREGRKTTRSRTKSSNSRAAKKQLPGNQTPNTPDINESQIAALKVDQLRDRLRRRGITGTGDMRKDDLVKTLIEAMREGRKTTGRTSATTRRRPESTAPEAGVDVREGVPAPLPRPPANTPEHVVPSQPTVGDSGGPAGVGSGRSLMVDETDTVIASMLPPGLGPVDEVVTPEGTVIVPDSPASTGGSASAPAPRRGGIRTPMDSQEIRSIDEEP